MKCLLRELMQQTENNVKWGDYHPKVDDSFMRILPEL